MRAPVALVGWLVLSASSGGCSAIDNFGRFTFNDGGATGDASSSADSGLAAFGQACTPNECQQYGMSAAQPTTMCEMKVGSSADNIFPGGMCTRACTALAPCVEYNGGGTAALCEPLFGGMYCLAVCNVGNAPPCRKNYNCCNMGGLTTGPGACVPSSICN